MGGTTTLTCPRCGLQQDFPVGATNAIAQAMIQPCPGCEIEARKLADSRRQARIDATADHVIAAYIITPHKHDLSHLPGLEDIVKKAFICADLKEAERQRRIDAKEADHA